MKNNLNVIALLFMLLCMSCTEKLTPEAIVKKWHGKSVALPVHLTDLMTQTDIDLADTDYTILTYIPDAECTGCSLRLSGWNAFLRSVDSIAAVKVKSVIIVNTTDERKLKYVIRSHRYRHPVVIDSTGDINRNNSFPEDELYRTFLLDKTRRVVAVGNPLRDPAIAGLYLGIITGEGPGSFRLPAATKSSYDVGSLHIDEPYTGITVKNPMHDTLHIREVISSCDCMEVMPGSDFIVPGGTLPVTIRFNRNAKPGDFFREIKITYKENVLATDIELTGTITTEYFQSFNSQL